MPASKLIATTPGPAASPVCAAALLWAVLWVSPCLAVEQVQAQVEAPPARVAQAGRTAAPRASAPLPRGTAKRPTKPSWNELTAAQQQALAPLAARWDTVSESQKRKWLALSQNFPALSQPEQAILHSRMTEWAALSPQQRTQARLNFGQTKQLSPDAKRAKWEAYQALSPEEKHKLAARAPKPPPAAAAVKPAPNKLAVIPRSKHRTHSNGDDAAARIAAAPNQVDRKTLLPQQAPPQPAPDN